MNSAFIPHNLFKIISYLSITHILWCCLAQQNALPYTPLSIHDYEIDIKKTTALPEG